MKGLVKALTKGLEALRRPVFLVFCRKKQCFYEDIWRHFQGFLLELVFSLFPFGMPLNLVFRNILKRESDIIPLRGV